MTANDQDQVREKIAQQLFPTPFACSSLTRLSGGTANFVYRGILASSGQSIIIKHTKDHSASNPTFKIDLTRCHFEAAILRALDGLAIYTTGKIIVKSPRLLDFNRATDTQVVEDLPNSIDLKNFLLSEVSHNLSESSGRDLGSALGSWLRSFHLWTAEKQLTKELGTNQEMKNLKFWVNYTLLINTIEDFPDILGEDRDIFEKVRDLAAAELERQTYDDGYGIIHGDFWTGNVLLPNVPPTHQSETTVFIADWEMSQIGSRALDLGQMIAELYETKLFKNLDGGLWMIQGFLKGYGHLDDEMAFRTVIHIGVHLICFGSRVPGWGTEKQIEEVVKVGRDLIVHGWRKDKAWLADSTLGCLFTL
ncbi:Aminoglycoside phosphotransferase [Penicillium coprophilum]|uniref:Aminoglycoside phosphotransferase n=1 Tax=Penicillium coprophilum TaxID=36646 RepID=UPI002382BC3E|nr:Aminoglycoside phosphotransferase [Penicillium coprophilum]KAJ5162553.1 Aminoglycoside phosphotransferase [Penicillium coprophilum]